jgi:hypothetical protein
MDVIQNGPTVTYGDLHTTDPVKHTVSMNGHLEAFVVEDLGESLISVRDYTRNGNEVIFTSRGEIIKNPFYNNEIKKRNLVFCDAEKMIFSGRHNVAGTIDCLFKKNNNDEHGIVYCKNKISAENPYIEFLVDVPMEYVRSYGRIFVGLVD